MESSICGPDCCYCFPVYCLECNRLEYECNCEAMDALTDKPAGRGNKSRTEEIVRRSGLCGFCPKHDGENRGRRCRSDHHKSQRKGRC